MGFFDIKSIKNIIFPDKNKTAKKRSIDLESWMDNGFARNMSAAGLAVNENTAFNLSALWGCVSILAKTIGSLPVKVYKKTDDGKEPDTTHPLYYVLWIKPNSEMTSFHFFQYVMYCVSMSGNFYAEIQRDRANRIIALWPITPSRVEVKRDSKKNIIFKVSTPDGGGVTLQKHEMLHIKGLSSDGLVGLSVFAAAREVLGLGLAEQNSAALFFSNGSQLSGVLEHPKSLSDPAHDRLKGAWNREHQGLTKAHRIAILEEGMKYKTISVSPQDAQLLGSRKFTTEEVARFFGIPLHKIQNLEKATNNNIEHQSMEFYTDAIRPWTVNIEQEMLLSLFNPKDNYQWFAKFIIDAILRADIEKRFNGYQKAINGGWMNADEVREKEDMNHLPDGLGKKYYVPLNMQEVGKPIPEDK